MGTLRRRAVTLLLAAAAMMGAAQALAQVPGIGAAIQQSEATRLHAPNLRAAGDGQAGQSAIRAEGQGKAAHAARNRRKQPRRH